MKSITTLLFIVFLPFLISAQLFEEHLSHDRLSVSDMGHFWSQGELILVMGNGSNTTMEGIIGEGAKLVYLQSDFTYDHSTFLTGINDKTINLFNPRDLDINGFGGFSIQGMDEHSVFTHSIGNTPEAYITCAGVKISYNGPTSECIDENGTIHIFNTNYELIESKEGFGDLKYHEGSNGEELAIKDGKLGTFFNYIFQPELSISENDKIYNNPFSKGYEILRGNKRITYNSIFDKVGEYIYNEAPIAIDIKNEAVYTLIKTGNEYTIYKNFTEGGSSVFFTVDQTPNGQEFEILDLEVRGLFIYLFGMHTDPATNVSNHMVRQFNVLGSMAPPRRNVAITDFEIEKSGPDENQLYTYQYSIDVTNDGGAIVKAFDIYSDLTNYNGLYYTNISERFDGELAPGETVTLAGNFTGSSLTNLKINIPGSDYMLDALPNDNSAEFIFTTSTSDFNKQPSINLYPNPTFDFLTIESLDSEYSIIGVFDNSGREMKLPFDDSMLDTRGLNAGKYFVKIQTIDRLVVLSFVKV